MAQNAYVLRIAPSEIDRLDEALEENQLLIGWAEAQGLLDESLDWERFREIIRHIYYRNEPTLRRAGAAAGHMWRFIRDMKKGDLVVVPYGSNFYIAEVAGPPIYVSSARKSDTAYRRPARWLNDKRPLPRHCARSALLSRMKVQGTSADASDLLDEIKECLSVVSRGETPTFDSDLKMRLVQEVVKEMRTGRIESFGFEKLICSVLTGLGALDCRIVPRSEDKGADIIATFRVAGAFQQRVAVQAKHWRPEPPVDAAVVNQLIQGIEAEGADLGVVITSGSISAEAQEVARRYYEDEGIRIELVDGEQFAKLIVEHGIRTN